LREKVAAKRSDEGSTRLIRLTGADKRLRLRDPSSVDDVGAFSRKGRRT
jgi:hypothetical protein